MDDLTKNPETAQEDFRSGEDLEILTQILSAFRKLSPEDRPRMLQTVTTFLGMNSSPSSIPSIFQTQAASRAVEGAFSEDRSISPKQFMLEKQPKTDVEKVACLAYYLTHYRGIQHFKTLDISQLNTEAAQVKFTNAGFAVDNATKSNYLATSIKGSKQISALGEQFVLALPDRDKARQIMVNFRPRRKTRRANSREEEES